MCNKLNTRMKIILISPLLQPYRITFYEKLSGLFNGFKVFYSMQQKEAGRPQHNKDVNFPAVGFPERKISFLGYSIIMVKGMFRAIKEEKPDIIIIQGIPGNLTYRQIVGWANNNRIKVVFWYCGWEPNRKRNFLLQAIKSRLASSYYRKGDCFITYSTKAKDDLIAGGFSRQKLNVALNGIEIDAYRDNNRFAVEAVALKERHAGQNRVFLYVGGLLEEKRVLLLTDAFIEFSSVYPDTRLWIIGDGPQRDELERKIRDHSNIDYFGRIIENVEPYFIAADFFVLPGTGGLALNQAMYFETPCIAGRADGTEKDLVIDDVTGFNFIEDNKMSLVSKLQEAYNIEPDKLNLMKKNGKELIIKRSNVNNMVKVFNEVLSEINNSEHENPNKEKHSVNAGQP